MSIDQAKSFISRLSRTGEIPSGLAIALGTLFDTVEEQAKELQQARKEIEELKAHPIQAIHYRDPPSRETASVKLLIQLSSGLDLGAKL